MKDEETLSQHGVASGNVLHLVKGAKPGQPTDTPAATTSAATQPAAAATQPSGTVPGIVPQPAAGAGNMMDPAMMQAAMAQMGGMGGIGSSATLPHPSSSGSHLPLGSVEAQLKYENDRLKLALAQR